MYKMQRPNLPANQNTMGNGTKDLYYLAMVASAESLRQDRGNEHDHNHSDNNTRGNNPLSSIPPSALKGENSQRYKNGGFDEAHASNRVATITIDGSNREGIRRSNLFNCTTNSSRDPYSLQHPGRPFDVSMSEFEPTPIGSMTSGSYRDRLSTEERVEYQTDYHPKQELRGNFKSSSHETNFVQQEDHQIQSQAYAKKEKQRFLTFIYALYKHIDESSKTDESSRNIKVQVRQIVKECTRSNRLKIPGYSPLVNVIKTKLQSISGIDPFWCKANQSMNRFWANRELLTDSKRKRVIGV